MWSTPAFHFARVHWYFLPTWTLGCADFGTSFEFEVFFDSITALIDPRRHVYIAHANRKIVSSLSGYREEDRTYARLLGSAGFVSVSVVDTDEGGLR